MRINKQKILWAKINESPRNDWGHYHYTGARFETKGFFKKREVEVRPSGFYPILHDDYRLPLDKRAIDKDAYEVTNRNSSHGRAIIRRPTIEYQLEGCNTVFEIQCKNMSDAQKRFRPFELIFYLELV
jgi:hypothetical protein